MSSLKDIVKEVYEMYFWRVCVNFWDWLMSREFIRFTFVGIGATFINYVIYFFIVKILNASIAFSIGYLVSFFFNFWLSAKFTFKTDATVKRGLGFSLSHLLNYVLQMLVLNISINFGVPDQFAPIPVYLICDILEEFCQGNEGIRRGDQGLQDQGGSGERLERILHLSL